MVSRRTLVKGSIVAPVGGSAAIAALQAGPAFAQDDAIKVGSKDFTEQFILGHMYIKVLEDMGLTAEDNTNLGGTQIAHQALVSGDISLYPEYTGTGLTEVLGLTVEDALGGGATPVAAADAAATPVATDASQAVFDLVKAEYLSQFGLVWLERSPANNTQALAVTRAFSEENGITTISQLSEIVGDLVISAPADFPEREDGLLGLQRVYGGGFQDVEVLPVAPGVKYQAIQDESAQVVLAFGTDGQIAGYDLVVLEDDLGLWPPYNVAPVVRQDVLEANPEIEERFNAVTTSLTDEVLSGLNWRVDGDAKEEPADVAESYLKDNGFIAS
jgi:osmoprotectant transport system substrate-binding protein